MPNLMKHVIQFCVAYAGCSVLVYAVTTMLNFDAPSSMGIISMMASTTYPIQSFVKDQQRAPTKSERSLFAFFTTLASLALSAVVFLGFMAVYQVGISDVLTGFGVAEVPAWVWGLIALFTVGLSWVVVYFFSGFIAKQAMKRALNTK
jgi:hypothetical protein